MSQSRKSTITNNDEKKLLTLGETTVGKSSFINYFIDKKFSLNYLPTLGFDFKVKKINLPNGKNVKLRVFDTAGQERFKSMSLNHLKKVDGILLIYDITNKATFENITKWINDIRQSRGKTLPVVLCGNKCDLEDRRVIPTEMGKKKAEENGMSFIETSCKDGINIDEAFMELVKLIFNNSDENEGRDTVQISRETFKTKNVNNGKSSCC